MQTERNIMQHNSKSRNALHLAGPPGYSTELISLIEDTLYQILFF
jgi:hypothetical protein